MLRRTRRRPRKVGKPSSRCRSIVVAQQASQESPAADVAEVRHCRHLMAGRGVAFSPSGQCPIVEPLMRAMGVVETHNTALAGGLPGREGQSPISAQKFVNREPPPDGVGGEWAAPTTCWPARPPRGIIMILDTTPWTRSGRRRAAGPFCGRRRVKDRVRPRRGCGHSPPDLRTWHLLRR
jgi:hypothetical protein